MTTVRQGHGADLLRRVSMGASIWHHHHIVLSILDRWVASVASAYVHGRLLDYGCGGQPYRQFLSGRWTHYVGADLVASRGIEPDLLFKPGQALPMENESFDTILSTQTLEHVRDVVFYLRDCKRLLRPGGHLILTVPMQWRMHEQPNDFWRFTRHGLIALLADAGLSPCEISPCGGAWALAGQVITSHLSETGRGSRWTYALVNRLALWADRRLKDEDETIGWMCIAQRAVVEPQA